MPEQLCSCRENQDEPSDFEVQGDFLYKPIINGYKWNINGSLVA
jgi:hypothetical protein